MSRAAQGGPVGSDRASQCQRSSAGVARHDPVEARPPAAGAVGSPRGRCQVLPAEVAAGALMART